MKKQVRYVCGHCNWFVLTDLFVETQQEADTHVISSRFAEARRQHYRDEHPELVAEAKLRRVLMAALI